MRDSLYRTFLNVPPELTGRGVCIAVVDGDFRPHPDIASTERRTVRFVRAADEVPQCLPLEEAPGPWPGGGHGLWATAVAAGTGAAASGRYAGVAPDADLLLVAGWRPGLPPGQEHAGITRAMRWVLAHWREYGIRGVSTGVGAVDKTGLLPWPCDPLRLVAEALSAEGLLVVGASGNVDDLTAQAAPAGAPSVLAVGGATLPEDAARDRAAWDRTCRGRTFDDRGVPDVLGPATGCVVPIAPGGEAFRLWAPLGDGYARCSAGTSDAAPAVLGAAACVWQAHPDWSATQVRGALTAGAERLPEWEGLGAGLVSVSGAVGQAPVPMPDNAGWPFSRRERWRKADPEEGARALRCAEGEDLIDVVLAFLPEGVAGAAADVLRTVLAHGVPRVRAAALCALVAGPEAVAAAEVRSALADPDPRMRAAGLHALLLRPALAEGCRDFLPGLLADDSTDIRFTTVQLAERLGDAGLARAVAAGLEDDARLDRVGCFHARCRALRALTERDVQMPAAPQGDLRPWRLEQAARWRQALWE